MLLLRSSFVAGCLAAVVFVPAGWGGRVCGAAEPVAAGFRQVAGKHLTLVTDLPPSPAVDELPRLFDAAFPRWCEYLAPMPTAGRLSE